MGRAALLLAVSGVALAVPDVCDLGGGELVGTLRGRDQAEVTIRPLHADDAVGDAVAVGDYDGDGHPDLAVGVSGLSPNGTASGSVWVFFGPLAAGAPLDRDDADVLIQGEAFNDRTGSALANAGDVDGDGADDLLVGAEPPSTSSHGAGLAHLVYGATILSDTDIDLATEADARLVGTAAGDGFGSHLSAAGDVDGDGFADLLIGAPFAAGGGTRRGQAYLFLGPIYGARAAASADVALTGARTDSMFGWSPAGVGDLDGDGFDDVAVGASGDTTAGTDAGAVYVFHGGATLPSALPAASATLMISGRPGTRLGSAVSAAGDATGDGHPDVWLGARWWGTSKQGAAFLVSGTTPPGYAVAETSFWQAIYGVAGAGFVGSSVAGGGDFDQDGVLDVLVGGERGTGGAVGSGAAWVFYGPFVEGASRATPGAGATLQGTAYDDQFGAVTAVGDVNDDGYDDAVVGGWKSSDGLARGGTVAVFFAGEDVADLQTFYADSDHDGWGSSSAPASACSLPSGYAEHGGDCNDADATWYPAAPEACGVDDKNCDGSVGAVDRDFDGVTACGGDCNDAVAAIRPGAADLCGDGVDSDCNGEIDGSTATDATTWYVDGDADGYGNRAVGVRACTRPTGTATFLATGGDCDDADATIKPGTSERCDLVDNDCDDLVDESDAVGASWWYRDGDADGYGNVHVPMLSCAAPEVAESGHPVAYVRATGDCDDAAASVHPGAPEICDLVDDDCDGEAYLGGRTSAESRDFLRLVGGTASARYGTFEVPAFLPDQDFDGDDELVLGLPSASDGAANGGVVQIRLGGADGGLLDVGTWKAAGPGSYDARIVSGTAGARLGTDLATGDFNGDGIVDLAIGAPGAKVPDTDQGAVYVYFGPLGFESLRLADADVTLKGEAAGQLAGAQVESADLDGDGYDDLVVVAPQYGDGTGAKRGRTYVVYGASSLLGASSLSTRPSWTGFANELLGTTLAIGDLDGDGKGDLVAGSPDGADLTRGLARVVYGGSARFSGALTAAATLKGSATGERFSQALVDAGDLDHDGFDDLAIGTGRDAGVGVWVVRGRAARLSGTLAITGVAQLRLTSGLGTGIGPVVAALGDVDHDGFDDLAVGAADDDELAADEGAAYVVYGRASFSPPVAVGGTFTLDNVVPFAKLAAGTTFPTLTPDSQGRLHGAKVRGAHASDAFGSRIAGGGDLDGDGFPDFVVNAPNADLDGKTDRGALHVFRGGAYGVDLAATDAPTWSWDRDRDTWTTAASFTSCPMHVPTTYTGPGAPYRQALPGQTSPVDCDDTTSARHPAATETDADGVDSNCDGFDDRRVDRDADGLYDDEEPTYGTSITLADTDGDGASDGEEVARGSSPTSASDTILGVEDLAPGDVRIVEVMSDPVACADVSGEYVELASVRGTRVSLKGLTISTLTASTTVGAHVVLPANGRVVVASNAVGFTGCYGGTAALVSGFTLDDAGDALTVSRDATTIASLDLRTSFPLAAGRAAERDDAGAWCFSPSPLASGDWGTPGAANGHACALTLADLAPGDLRITELLPDPGACSDADGEYVEVRYQGSRRADLTGLQVADAASTTAVPEVLYADPGDLLVLARSSAGFEACYGFTPDGSFAVSLNNAGGDVVSVKRGATTLDTVDYTTWAVSTGVAWERDPSGAPWCVASTDAGDGDLGSPGADNGACPAVVAGAFDGLYRGEIVFSGSLVTYGSARVRVAEAASPRVADPSLPDPNVICETWKFVLTGTFDAGTGVASGTVVRYGSTVPWAGAFVDVGGVLHLQGTLAGGLVGIGNVTGTFDLVHEGDRDDDGVSDDEEVLAGTDPDLADSDGDGLEDGRELFLLGTSPLVGDGDGDGLSDGEEVDVWLTDPFARDSDGDGYGDGIEVDNGTDPADGDDPGLAGAVSPFVQLAAGQGYTCGLRGDGTVSCWGASGVRQSMPPTVQGFTSIVSSGLGLTCGLRADGSVGCWGSGLAANVPAGHVFVAIAPGFQHGCGLHADGTTVCWGIGTNGRTTPPAGATFTALSAGRDHTCGLRADGTAACWGVNTSGQANAPAGVTFVALAAATNSTCGVRTDGTLRCWGNNAQGQATPPTGSFTSVAGKNTHYCATRTDGTAACWGWNTLGQAAAPAGVTFASVAAGSDHTCGLRADGTVRCWGGGTGLDVIPPGTEDWRSLAAGGESACHHLADGTVRCWGAWFLGPLTVPAGEVLAEVATSTTNVCGLRADGSVACWGDAAATSPPAGTFTSVTVGESYACGLRADGTAACWGVNTWNQLTPPADETFVQLDAFAHHTCGLRADGTALCWGEENYGALAVPPGATFTSISVGAHASCGLHADGSPECWGWLENYTPFGEHFTAIDLGSAHACGLHVDGTVACWGMPDAGSTNPYALLPPPGERFTAIGLTMQASCGLRADHTEVCWGSWVRPRVATGAADADRDALSDVDEAAFGTDPHLADSDGDGLTDGREVWIEGTDPVDPDSDDDGFDDGAEVAAATDPLLPGSHP